MGNVYGEETYFIGDVVRLSASFTNFAGAPTDPTTVTFKYKDPSGVIETLVYGTDAEVIKDSDGEFHVDIEPDAEGTWYYRAQGTGAVKGGKEGYLKIKPSEFD